MLTIGKINALRVSRVGNDAVFLAATDADGTDEILLRDAPVDTLPGQLLDVFLYHEDENTIVASATPPAAQVGQFAFMRTTSVTTDGAFMDWGLSKDLYIPPQEQQTPLSEGERALVHVLLDRVNGRIIGSTRIERYLQDTPPGYRNGDPVHLLIRDKTELGYKAVVDNICGGILYANEVFEGLHKGDLRQGYIKKVREDGKLDLSLHPPGFKKISGISERILDALQEADGFLPLTDKSPPDAIRAAFGESKKSFKMAIGTLYRKKKIRIDPDGIRLL